MLMLTLRGVGGGSVDRRSGVSKCRFRGVCGVTGSGLVSTPLICSRMATSRPTRTHSKMVDIFSCGHWLHSSQTWVHTVVMSSHSCDLVF